MLIFFNLLAFASFHLVHSRWLACTDYIEKNGDYWNPKLCRGYPRDAKRYAKKEGFGVDLGYDHKPANGIRTCKTQLTSNSYSYHYPKAVYYPGQQVVLVHPMKGHASASCTNMWIPDFGSKVFRGRMKKDANRYYTFYKKNVVADLGTSPFGLPNTAPNQYPRRGYQNAPKFCEDPDRSMGTYSFNVPMNLTAGSYTFVWSWAFNNPTDLYTTCFDVVITKNKAERYTYLKRRSRWMDVSVPCGGLVSNGERGSNVGCEMTTTKTESVTTEAATIIINPITRNYNSTAAPTTPKKTTTKVTTTPATTARRTTTTTKPTTTAKLTTTKATTPRTTTTKSTTTKATTPKATTPRVTTSKATTTTKLTTTKATTPRTTTTKSTTTKATTPKATTPRVTTSKATTTTKSTTTKATTTTKSTEQKLPEVTNTTTKPQTVSTTILTTTTTVKTRNTFLNKFLPIYAYQLSGVFKIGIPPTAITRRWLKVNFHCNIRRATFYNAEITEQESNGVYQILQAKTEDVSSGKVKFFIEFESCIITKKPRVELLHEE